ncbi:cubilin-like [Strongylocentrotus purpuratus]|uniref:CUB domain-containing protein n=1 Tax=Strongylocentrotus purpuratus TaxID=7668 RepID=A0A7M7NLA1_STRPU|nr:cubilin-like [Strongylocentrotus purpuratus]
MTGKLTLDNSPDDIHHIRLSINQSVAVASPGNPNNYPNNLRIAWFFEVAHGNSAILNFTAFDLEAGYDYLKVGFGNDSGLEETRLITLSGNTVPTEINTRHRTIWMEFSSDSAIGGEGFLLEVRGEEDTIDISPLDFQSKDDQTFLISSQNHPQNYSHNSLVSYIIEAPEGSYIYVKVSFFDTENGKDILFIGEGTEVGKKDTLRDAFTGDLNRKYSTVESNTRWLWVMFVSDYKNAGAGYQMSITYVTPNIRLSLDETITILSTTNLEYSSRQFSVARWRIEAPDDTIMNIRFLEFDLAPSLEFFVVLDGLRPHNRERYRFEYDGNQLPPDIVSLSNRMNIVFATYSDTLNGTFVIDVTARAAQHGDLSPTRVPAGGTVSLTSPNYPGPYQNYFQRIWVVAAPKGYIIRFRFLDIRLPNDNDFVKLGDGFYYLTEGTEILIVSGQSDMTHEDVYYYTETNAIWLHFKSDPTDGNGGFKLEISAITLPIVLDVNDVHTLESPTYPMPYENNVFIEWNVEVPPGFGVLLRFISFGLTDPEDVLSVGKGSDSNDSSSVAGRFTGLLTPSDFVVWSDRVWIRFTSDSSGLGDGFVIELRPIEGEGHCLIPLGMESGWIPDNSLSATSQRDKTHSSSQARLHGTSSWIPDPDVDDSTIQVNFDQGHYITGILIQGGLESVGTWLESVLVTFEDESAEIVHGTWNPESVSLILFVRPRLTSHIRITPRSKNPNLLALRFEILGCQSGCHFDLGLASGILELTNIEMHRALNESESNFENLRLWPYEHRPLTGWGGRSSSYDGDWVEVFIGSRAIVREVIIQQCDDGRILSFNLTAMSDDVSHIFQFDISDCETAMCKVTLPEGIIATRYRVLPIDWNNRLCFRLELIGCYIIDCASRYCEENCSSAYLSPDVATEISTDQSRAFPPRAMCHQEIRLPVGHYVVFIFHGFQWL